MLLLSSLSEESSDEFSEFSSASSDSLVSGVIGISYSSDTRFCLLSIILCICGVIQLGMILSQFSCCCEVLRFNDFFRFKCSNCCDQEVRFSLSFSRFSKISSRSLISDVGFLRDSRFLRSSKALFSSASLFISSDSELRDLSRNKDSGSRPAIVSQDCRYTGLSDSSSGAGVWTGV